MKSWLARTCFAISILSSADSTAAYRPKPNFTLPPCKKVTEYHFAEVAPSTTPMMGWIEPNKTAGPRGNIRISFDDFPTVLAGSGINCGSKALASSNGIYYTFAPLDLAPNETHRLLVLEGESAGGLVVGQMSLSMSPFSELFSEKPGEYNSGIASKDSCGRLMNGAVNLSLQYLSNEAWVTVSSTSAMLDDDCKLTRLSNWRVEGSVPKGAKVELRLDAQWGELIWRKLAFNDRNVSRILHLYSAELSGVFYTNASTANEYSKLKESK